MTATQVDPAPGAVATFRHEAMFYSGDDGFLAGTVPFLTEAIKAEQPTLVVVSADRIDSLRSALDGPDDCVFFADMSAAGRNPARIIPAWRAFLDCHASDGRPVRGIGEPIWAARTPAELVECQRHEALLERRVRHGLAVVADVPHDVDALSPQVVDEAVRTHPFIRQAGGECVASSDYRAEEMSASHRSASLSEPTRCLESMTFRVGHLALVRALAEARGSQFGLTEIQLDDLVLAVHEIAANSVRHGGGQGRFRLWRDGRSLVAEISDGGNIADPLAGRERPGATSERGRGLWIANQVCDLVQIRSSPTGSVVRLFISLDAS